MPENQPQPPEGCVYGPWWDEEIRSEGCWCYSDGNLSYAWLPSFATWVVTEKAALRELLRVAAERDDLRAEVERLKADKLEMATILAQLHAGTMPTWKDLKGAAK